MLVDRYQAEDVFARVPQMVQRIDPVLKELDQLLEDDQLYQQVRTDEGSQYRWTLVHGRHCTPVEVLLRMLEVSHLQTKVTKGRKLRLDARLSCRPPSIIPPIADLILVLDQGTIIERGTHEQLLRRNGYYTRLIHS